MTEPVGRWSFEEFVARRSGALQRFACLVTGSREAAPDAVREALLGLRPHWDQVAATADAATRRSMLAANGARWHQFGGAVPAFDPTGARPDPAHPFAAAMDSDQAARVFATLSVPGRAAVVLRCAEQASFSAIAESLGMPETSVRSLVDRALGSLGATLADAPDPGGQRAATAFRSYLAAQDAEFPPLQLEASGQVAPPRRQWRPVVIAAVAAIAVGLAGFGVHRVLTAGVTPTEPPSSSASGEPTGSAASTPEVTSTPTADWQVTAAIPLASRSGAIASWIDHEFVVVGGSRCPQIVEPASDGTVDCAGDPAVDGAAYDPSTDRWRTIAAPPGELDDSASWAVLGQTLYVMPDGRSTLWAYDLVGDTWQELPPAPSQGADMTTQLVALGEVLLALGQDGSDDSWFDPESAEWTQMPAHTYPSGDFPDGTRRAAVFTGAELVIGEPVRTEYDTIGLNFTVFDPNQSGRLYVQPSAVVLPSSRYQLQLVANASAAVVGLPVTDGAAVYRLGGAAEWRAIPDSDQPAGPLRSGLVVGDLVSLEGNLFDPGAGRWQAVPAQPDAVGGGLVQAGGPGLVLSCFASTGTGQLLGDCQLLRV